LTKLDAKKLEKYNLTANDQEMIDVLSPFVKITERLNVFLVMLV
jgi:hypothetical protein